MAEPTLYERLGGIFAIAAVADRFSERVLKNPKIVDANPDLHEWHTVTYRTRLPGLKWGRTLWLADVAGGPYEYTGREMRAAWQNSTRVLLTHHAGTARVRAAI